VLTLAYIRLHFEAIRAKACDKCRLDWWGESRSLVVVTRRRARQRSPFNRASPAVKPAAGLATLKRKWL